MKKIKKFLANVKREMKRVRWPKKQNMLKYSIATLACIVILGLFFVGCDLIIAGLRSLAEGLK